MWEHGPAGPGTASATFVAGDSAGGGLTVATLLKTRDDGGRQVDAAVTLSAFADMTLSGASIEAQSEDDVMVSKAVLDRMIRETLPNGELENPLISPIFADLSQLPPLYLLVGGAEVAAGRHDAAGGPGPGGGSGRVGRVPVGQGAGRGLSVAA